MTRFIHDQFAKDYLEELLSPYGEVQAPRRVAGEVREIDVWFAPYSQQQTPPSQTLGLLGRFAATPSIFEPYRNAANENEICDCLLKMLEIRGEFNREANRKNTNIQESDYPKLWILTPTASPAILSGFRAIVDDDWLPGVYFLADYLRAAIVVIHQLPRTPETLWLRILGKGRVQNQAVDELEALAPDNPFRVNALRLLHNLRSNLNTTQNSDREDRELVMRLAPLFEQEIQQGVERGIQQGVEIGQRSIVENMLRIRFGSLDEQLSAIIEPLLALPPEEFTSLLLQLANLSREEVLARFDRQS